MDMTRPFNKYRLSPPAIMLPSLSLLDHRRRLTLLLNYAAKRLAEPARHKTSKECVSAAAFTRTTILV